jgi:hypothetical protein
LVVDEEKVQTCAAHFSSWSPFLKDNLPVAAGILAISNIPDIACFPAVVAGVS